jgi:hypothetical protein
LLDDLRALVEFAQAGSIAGAADRLFRTPSAITRQLQRLEAAHQIPPQPQLVEPRQERKWRYVVVVNHDTNGVVRIPTDVFDEMNAVTQAERRNPGPGYSWNSAIVERLPIIDGAPD